VSYEALLTLPCCGQPENMAKNEMDPAVVEQLEISAKYQGYIDRQAEEVARSGSYESTVLPIDLDYSKVAGLSNEVKQKLAQHKPQTIGQASRIQGVTPAAISLLLIHLKRFNLSQAA
jgi:tRNA uridine 5-carboxymethylaminomethyl modification enzyme